jgi:hypothetical protein
MDAESFFERWSRRNAELAAERKPAAAENVPPPSLEDVASLTPDSDFTRFVARGVDESIRRSAMKKLFADPRFNVMDGLDVYIEDYNSFTPIPAALLATLHHARDLLDPLARLAPEEDAAPEKETDALEETPVPTSPIAEEEPSHGDPLPGL